MLPSGEMLRAAPSPFTFTGLLAVRVDSCYRGAGFHTLLIVDFLFLRLEKAAARRCLSESFESLYLARDILGCET